MTKYVFILGGVVSSLGKGVASAALGSLLQARGYKVRMRKMDPYLNLDPGTMSPYQHGEVFVTDDGAETDLDLGHYERFVGISCHKTDTISGGKIYDNVLNKERNGEYGGATIQMIPHVTNELKLFMDSDITNEDFVLYEVGGTVGDIEGTLFLEAARQFANEKGRKNVCFVYLTLLPYVETAGELKTKPTQQAVKKLMEAGISADVLLCRSKLDLGKEERRKLGLFCNVDQEDVIPALDVKNIYEIPLAYHKQGLDNRVLNHFGMLESAPQPNLSKWENIVQIMNNFEHSVKIGVVGKYCGLEDAYKSLKEALIHAGIANKAKVNIEWIESDSLEKMDKNAFEEKMNSLSAILVPGGFGYPGCEGKIRAIQYAREKKIPFLGIGLGMQLSVIEAGRNLLQIKDANSTEFSENCTPMINRMKIVERNGIKTITSNDDKSKQIRRLGAYPCVLKEGSLAYQVYKQENLIQERHRHYYEMDIAWEKALAEKGMIISGKSPDGFLPEIIEIKDHPFFIAVQFQPELKSKPFAAHPLFVALIQESLKQKVLL